MDKSIMKPSDFKFVTGAGNPAQGTACAMSAAVALWRVEHGEDIGDATDSLYCVCLVIRKLVVRRNDIGAPDLQTWAERIVPRLAGTKADSAVTLKRAEFCVRYVVRGPVADLMKRSGFSAHAKAMRDVTDITPMEEIRRLCRAASVAASAAADADAVEATYASSYAADAAAVAAAADAVAAAAAAASAVAASAVAAVAAAAAAAAAVGATYASSYAATTVAVADAIRAKHLDAMIEGCFAIKEAA